MTGSVERALVASTTWLLEQDAPEAVIAAHESDVASDDEDARRWIRRLLDEQEPDGSWSGRLLETAGTLLPLAELRHAAGLKEQDPAIGRGLDWLRSRRGVPGAWTDGCSPERHRHGLCHHFAGGFFSPGPPEEPRDRALLRCGVEATGDHEVRFVASTVALRSVLRWSQAGRDARLHIEGLRRVVELWPDSPPAGLSHVALLAAIHGLLDSDLDEDRAAADRGLRIIAGRQRGDGSWVDTDPFQALDVFADADRVRVSSERSRRALWHGARLLISTQNADGSWGGEAPARRALIAWRTLRRLDPGEAG